MYKASNDSSVYLITYMTALVANILSLITDTSVSDTVAVLSAPDVSTTLQSITVTCTIHPESTADQCVVMAMDDNGRVISTGNHIGTVSIYDVC